MEAAYKDRGAGIYPIGECFVTVSLSEPHDDGYCYKLVAAVMTPGWKARTHERSGSIHDRTLESFVREIQ